MNESDQLKSLDKYAHAYLSRRICGLCDLPLNRLGCGAIYEDCGESLRIDRRKRCLAEYKPRLNRRHKKSARK